ncbi:MAG: arginine--tRNA ligase [Parachlamydiales bacterium]|nr:arginine--tRNA ligase [Parachlamydiales bacterium]
MDSLISILRSIAQKAICKAFGNQGEWDTAIFACHNEKFGHYQCNAPLGLAKEFHSSPREIAKKIVEHWDSQYFSNIEIAGPGFINVTFSREFLSSQLNEVLVDPYLGATRDPFPEKIIVEFSSPNIAKELHVGHLRSTIIGDCIARLFEFFDRQVLRLNHVGDWGTQFGMLIAYLKKYCPAVIAGEENPELTSLDHWYKEAKKLFDKDAEFKKISHQEVVHLQSGEKEALRAWKIICDISRREFERIYSLLDIKILERGESYYNDLLPEIVAHLEKQGLITLSDGAKCLFLEGFANREGEPLPLIVQKSDGGYLYATTDLAAFYQRAQREKADRIIVVTDIGQTLHFQMVYAAALKAHLIDPQKTSFDHVTFGLVLGDEGKKLRTREGNTEKLMDLINQAMNYAEQLIRDRIPDIDPESLHEMGRVLGIDAIKYADLSSYRLKDYQFSYERMLKFEGNTAPFLLYSYVRIQGIKRKAEVSLEPIIKTAKISLEHPSEVLLGLHLRRFGEVINAFEKDLLPNRLADYLYNLAEKFNIFFRDCRVVGSVEQDQRLLLCELTAKILKTGLNILGLKVLNRM